MAQRPIDRSLVTVALAKPRDHPALRPQSLVRRLWTDCRSPRSQSEFPPVLNRSRAPAEVGLQGAPSRSAGHSLERNMLAALSGVYLHGSGRVGFCRCCPTYPGSAEFLVRGAHDAEDSGSETPSTSVRNSPEDHDLGGRYYLIRGEDYSSRSQSRCFKQSCEWLLPNAVPSSATGVVHMNKKKDSTGKVKSAEEELSGFARGSAERADGKRCTDFRHR